MIKTDFSALEAHISGLFDFVLQKPKVKSAYEQVVKDTVTYGIGMSVLRPEHKGFNVQPIDSFTALGNAIHQELEPGTKNVRIFKVKGDVVLFSDSGIYASRMRQMVSDLHKQDPHAKYYLLWCNRKSWEKYYGKKPFNNAISSRFKPLHPKYVPAILHSYQLICPEDD